MHPIQGPLSLIHSCLEHVPVYLTLNICHVTGHKADSIICSKWKCINVILELKNKL